MEINNKLTVTRREREGGYWGKEVEGLSRNMYKGPVDKGNGRGKRLNGGGGVGGVGESNGGKMGTTVIAQQ